MTLEELKKLCDAAPNDGDEQDWLDAWREVGPKLIAVAEAAKLTQYGHTTSKGRWETSEVARNAVTNALAALEAK